MKIATILSLVLALCLLSLIPVFAYDFETDSGLNITGGQAGYTQTERGRSIPELIGLVIGILLGFVGVIFLGLMIYGGFTWMMARGNESEADKAKKIIEQSIIGLVIVLAAYAITYFVGQALQPTPTGI